MLQRITVEEAQDLLCRQMETILKDRPKASAEQVDIEDAIGRILAEDVEALYDQPPFPRSPLDGYAFRGADSAGASKETPVTLKVVGKIYAGEVYHGIIHEGEALRLMTGAPIPEGADAVIPQEATDWSPENTDAGYVQLYRSVKPYGNYCFAGEDYHRGDVLLQKGHCLSAGDIAILSSLGRNEVTVQTRPGIVVYATGDEVVEPGRELLEGKIYDANRHYVKARLKQLGIPVTSSAHIPDDAERMAETIRQAAKACSLIITTGGVSVGEKDIFHEVVRLLNAETIFWKVKVKPGSPTLAFRYKDTLIISLSGNPFGCVANLELLVRPVLVTLTGNPALALRKEKAILTGDYRKPAGARRFLRGHLEDHAVTLTYGLQTSGAVASLAGCNCFLEITEQMEGARKGEEVWVYPL